MDRTIPMLSLVPGRAEWAHQGEVWASWHPPDWEQPQHFPGLNLFNLFLLFSAGHGGQLMWVQGVESSLWNGRCGGKIHQNMRKALPIQSSDTSCSETLFLALIYWLWYLQKDRSMGDARVPGILLSSGITGHSYFLGLDLYLQSPQ